jgi:ABC-type branched-subunit amino acid transport system ATPase component
MRFAGVTALDGIELEIQPGETVGVLGPNGSGKTTLVNCLSGVLRPSAGTIRLDGRDVTRMPMSARAHHGVVRTFQNLRLFGGLTAAENVEIGLATLHRLNPAERRARVLAALHAQNIEDVAGRTVRELPYGVQRRVEIARALVTEPALLLLDEPGAGLGQAECEALAAALIETRRSTGCSILLIDHNVPFVSSVSDRLVLVAGGKVVRNAAPAALLADPTVAEFYLGKSAVHA